MIKKLTIDRAKWGFGENGGNMYNPDTQKFCVLGFYAVTLGLEKKVKNLNSIGPIFTPTIDGRIAYVNDNNWYDEHNLQEKREKRIGKLFKKQGIKVEFVGKYET